MGGICRSTLPLTVIGRHSLGIYTVILLSLLSFSSKMKDSPAAGAAHGDEEQQSAAGRGGRGQRLREAHEQGDALGAVERCGEA
jgi:hypothetical protein